MNRASWLLWGAGWLAVTTSVFGGWPEWGSGCCTDFHRVNCWPAPFAELDRQAARDVFSPFIESGWQLENTLLEPLFDEQGELTRAGKRRVRTILTQYPVHRRMVWVAAAETLDETQRRVQSVTKYVATIADQPDAVPVHISYRIPRGGTGDYLNIVSERYRQNLPAPVLPQSGSSSGGGQATVTGSP